jgi:hypothetical protein
MTTRDVLRWNLSPRDLVQLAQLALAGAALVVLTAAATRVERWIDLTATR